MLATAYFHAVDFRPQDPEWEGRNRFLLSNGHYAIALRRADRGWHLHRGRARRKYRLIKRSHTIKHRGVHPVGRGSRACRVIGQGGSRGRFDGLRGGVRATRERAAAGRDDGAGRRQYPHGPRRRWRRRSLDHHAHSAETVVVWSGDFTVEFRDRALTLAADNAASCRPVPSTGAPRVMVPRSSCSSRRADVRRPCQPISSSARGRSRA